MVQMKALGYDKEFCIQTFMEGWETDCKFKTSFTDQTGDDLANAIGFLTRPGSRCGMIEKTNLAFGDYCYVLQIK